MIKNLLGKIKKIVIKEWKILLVLSVLAYPMYHLFRVIFGVMLIIGLAAAGSLYEAFMDDSTITGSPYLNREVSIAPIGHLLKLKGWGGWRDRYLYLYTKSSNSQKDNLISDQPITDYAHFKVIEVRRYIKILSNGYDVCIMENQSPPHEKVAVDCREIPAINEVTKAYKSIDSQITKNKITYVVFQYPHWADDKNDQNVILKVNNFKIKNISSKEELNKSFLGNEDENSYEDIADLNPFLVDNHRFHEAFIARLFQFADDYYLRFPSIKDGIGFRERVLSTEMREDIEQWIRKNYAENMIQRWALRLVSLHYQYSLKLTGRHYLPSVIATQHSQLVTCLSNFFQSQEPFIQHVSRLEKVYFNTPDLLKKLDEIKEFEKKDKKTYGPPICDRVSVPMVFNEGEIYL